MMNKAFYLSISILVLGFWSCKTLDKTGNEYLGKSKTDKINDLGNRYLELNRFSGVILATKGNELIYNNDFGLADYENKTPFTNTTAFKIGEISEVITGNIIRKMAKDDKFQLSDKISKYIPEIKADFTINNLLDHETNLPTIKLIKEQNAELKYSTITYANLATISSDNSGKSDLNYNILGLLIEKISKKSFQENITDYTKKMKLENTYFQKENPTLAVGYLYGNYRGNRLELQKSPVADSEVLFSSNGLKSTVKDLAKIVNFNSVNKLAVDGYLENDGFSYSIKNNPETEIAIIVLCNRRHPVATEILSSINSILQDKEYQLPLARKPVEIDKKLLNNYSGFYSLNENMTVEVLNENDSLFVMLGPNKIHLLPQSANQFYMQQMDAAIRFLTDKNNNVTEAVLLDGFLEGNKIKKVNK